MFPTPEGFDYFQSLPELDDEIQMILNDPYYGCFQMYGEDKKLLSEDRKKELFEEKDRVKKEKEKICVWRFLLTSYYLLNGK